MRRAERRRRTERRAGLALFGATFGLIACAALLFWAIGGSQPATALRRPFTLVRDDGRSVTDRDFRGATLLIYFGYTSCPDLCPTALGALAEAVTALRARGAVVQPLFITVDPANDRPERLRDYVRQFSPDLIGLSGSSEQIASAERAFGISAMAREGAGFNHSVQVSIVAPDGTYLGGVPATATGAELAALVVQALHTKS